MRTRRPGGIGRMPGIARTLSDRARPSRDPQADIDAAEAAAAQLGLGGLFGTLREAVERLGQASGGGEKTIDVGGREGRMVFGYSVRMGLDGAAEPFGNVADNGRAPDAAAPRQPIIDVYADGADIVVVAELPGIGEADVSVALEDAALLIAAAGWRKRVDLPAAVAPDSLRRSCRNGILEVRLARLRGEAP
jgi:HSP20 family protein